jgi:hypothetical protein
LKDQSSPPPAPPHLEGRAGGSGSDVRETFEKTSHETPRDAASERRFILDRIQALRDNPTLSDAEKNSAIADLTRLLPPE